MSKEKSSYKSEEIGKNFSIFGRYYSADEILEQILQITTKDVVNIAKKIFITKSTLSIIGSSKFNDDNYIKLCQDVIK